MFAPSAGFGGKTTALGSVLQGQVPGEGGGAPGCWCAPREGPGTSHSDLSPGPGMG